MDKALVISSRTPSEESAMSDIQSVNDRYEALVDKFFKSITQLEECLDAFQQFSDLQKIHQDFQKQIKDRLSTFSGILLIYFVLFLLITY
jgi:DNA repair ATPase RecN